MNREELTGEPNSALSGRANRWLAQFAPLLHGVETATAAECRARLKTLGALKGEAPAIQQEAASAGEPMDGELLSTFNRAAAQLDAVEKDVRRRLTATAPGDPEGLVDLQALRKDLAEVAARHELEEVVGAQLTPSGLRMKLSNGSLAGAGFMGIFSLGWLSFTTFHAVFMIGGMAHSFGPMAFALLGFYAIFYAAGIGMAYTAFKAACGEEVELEGRRLTIHRRFMGLGWTRSYMLDRSATVHTQLAAVRAEGSNAKVIAAQTEDGSTIQFGGGCPAEQQKRYVEQMNEYLHGVRE